MLVYWGIRKSTPAADDDDYDARESTAATGAGAETAAADHLFPLTSEIGDGSSSSSSATTAAAQQ